MDPGEPLSTDAAREFAVFAAHLNLTHAAAELHVTQPALHAKVRKLSAAVGHPLYRREGRRLVLTAEGEVVAELGRRVGAEVRRAAERLAAGQPRPLVLAAGEGAHAYVIGAAVHRLLADGQPLRLLTADGTTAIGAVRDGTADIAVAVTDVDPRDLDRTTISTYPQLIAVPATHPLARARTVSVADLDGVAMVLPPPGRPVRVALEAAARRAGVAVVPAVEAEGWAAMVRFVEMGLGAAVVNGCVALPDGLVGRRVVDLPEVTYGAFSRSDGDEAERIAAVLDVIRASAP